MNLLVSILQEKSDDRIRLQSIRYADGWDLHASETQFNIPSIRVVV